MYLTDYFNIDILRSSNKPMTEDEMRAVLRKYLPKDVKVKITDDYYEGSSFNSYTNVLTMYVRELYEEILLHEIGHCVVGRKRGTANWKLNQLKSGDKVSKDLIIQSENEAWDWARANASKPWGLRTRAAVKVSLRSYRVHLAETLDVVIPEESKKAKEKRENAGRKRIA
jgi:hypothetical protein